MPNFYVTFGEKYSHEPHPVDNTVHPDGYTKIVADNLTAARSAAFDNYGSDWAFIYEEDEFNAKYFPRGCTRTIKV